MAGLTGNSVKDTYKSLLRVDDNNGVDATLAVITDGEGVSSPLKIATNKIEIIPPSSNDTATFEISQTNGNRVFVVDTTNRRAGITVGNVSPSAVFHVEGELAAPDDLGDWDNYQFLIRGDGDTGDTAGMLLTTSADTYGGSAIIHEDTGSGGKGHLKFYTKQSTSAEPPVEALRLSDSGETIIAGPTVATRSSVTNLAGDGSIPITSTCVNVDANGSARTGIRFAGTGTAGQIIIVNNTGGETLQFHGTEGTALVRGIHADHDFMSPNGVYMFVSDGSLWNYIGGGVDTQPDEGLAAS